MSPLTTLERSPQIVLLSWQSGGLYTDPMESFPRDCKSWCPLREGPNKQLCQSLSADLRHLLLGHRLLSLQVAEMISKY